MQPHRSVSTSWATGPLPKGRPATAWARPGTAVARDPMSTLSDVALRAGVSISAVSRVLTDAPGARVSPQTRERIKAAATELNYRPNFAGRALRSSRTNVIALVAPDLTNAFLTELMLGVEEEVARLGYMV